MTTRIVVTGATSQVGDILLPILCSRGFHVSAVSRLPQESDDRPRANGSKGGAIVWIRKDIHSPEDFDQVLQADVLIHLAPLPLLGPLLPHVTRGGIRRIIAFS